MHLGSRLILSKDQIRGPLPAFIRELNLEVLSDEGDVDMPTGAIADDEIALGHHNGFLVIHHCQLPVAMIHPEYARGPYDHAYTRLQATTERLLSVMFEPAANGFGYGIHKRKEQLRILMGAGQGLFFQGNYGAIQEEEKLLMNNLQPNGKVLYNGTEYAIHEIGTELTEDVLFNFYGKNIFLETIRLRKFKVKAHQMKIY
ncbi:MAG TPA: hypothetical protein PKH43_00480 [Saprospiraceae bacterium]|nr:hypothetical protein [Saprospiraceae bacterium]